eukprot:TRINITY_DN2158_c1_g2_i1.p1 TRINITY_DN2158_c1_g2~~TRINITY_DN2158_c1_g2_i1.p1  ORF type:complete len:539 (-),score=127.60 TRINITY_DN2158_c1_g2_i1:35-1414(-)
MAARLGIALTSGEVCNVKLVKPATPGCETLPTVCLQAHQDIVKAHDSRIRPIYNHQTDPVLPCLKDGWLCAEGTSLGADNGAGIATALYVLECINQPHGKIEFLCTDYEEVGMLGVKGLSPSFLCPATKYIINLDSEEAEAICLGCSGAGNITLTIPVQREASGSDRVVVKIGISGLSGGHSGWDIHLSKANALKLLARLLLSAWDTGFVLSRVEGGSARNAIPRNATATVLVPRARLTHFRDVIEETAKMLEAEYTTQEPCGIGLSFSECSSSSSSSSSSSDGLTRASTRTVLSALKTCPSQPLRMSAEMPGLVETSCTTTLCSTKQDHVELLAMARTNRESQWQDIEQYMQALSDFIGGTMTITDKYPGWLPQPVSTLCKVAQQCHMEVTSKPCRLYAVHAGLECGILLGKFPRCEAISIGPKAENPHSCNERLLVKSVPHVMQWVCRILEVIQTKQ